MKTAFGPLDGFKDTMAGALATWFGAGLSPKAPGTAGSLAALPFVLGVLSFNSETVVAMVSLVLLLIGVWSGGIVGRLWGQVDHGAIVIDEVLGQLIAIAIPFFALVGWVDSIWLFSVGFVLFRIFDVLKPWPVDWLDRNLKNPWGVMLDDVAAGVWAGVTSIPLLALTLV